jgi:acetyltransferase-like isoleucine patch superfamily enzyme
MYDSLHFAEIGTNVTLYPNIVFVNPESIHLKSHIIISEFCWIHGGIKIAVGNFVHISPYSSITGGGLAILEDFVGLSGSVRIINGTEMIHGQGLTNPTIPREFRSVSRSYVHLQKHVFLGSDVVVHPGVTIAEGAVVGSNSVVTKDIQPWTINIGSPAKEVGKRPRETIQRLAEKLYAKVNVTPFDPKELLSLKTTQEHVPEE